MVNSFNTACRSSYGSTLGQTHWTLSGVSPQPVERLPPADSTTIRTRATVTLVVTSVPNFNGRRVLIGRKYRATSLTRTSLNLLIREVGLKNKELRVRRCQRDR